MKMIGAYPPTGGDATNYAAFIAVLTGAYFSTRHFFEARLPYLDGRKNLLYALAHVARQTSGRHKGIA
jgi:hypothetical protein